MITVYGGPARVIRARFRELERNSKRARAKRKAKAERKARRLSRGKRTKGTGSKVRG
jgi:hypothetical protein